MSVQKGSTIRRSVFRMGPQFGSAGAIAMDACTWAAAFIRGRDPIASDTLVPDGHLPWEPHITPAGKVQYQIDIQRQRSERSTEEVNICKREAADAVVYFQHCHDQCLAASAAIDTEAAADGDDGAVLRTVPWDSI